ncbi:hypothetical protein BGZ60DRAFT_428997 [Tricladium varicosporioides]|nr:hypothetical protein BGZ60DRAFT_428997 [Hymenoscyphus varicosporioides]
MTVLAAFSTFSMTSAGPIAARQVCGAAPTGTVAQTPLSQPTGITTAADCATQCKANSACLSFLFGLVDGVDKCILYSVPASSLPPSTNLVAYDIGCSSIPSVVPTASNPGGLARRQTHAAPVNAVPAGSPAPIAEPVVDDLAACLAACEGNPSCIAYTFESGVCKLFGPKNSKRQQTSRSLNTGSTTPDAGAATTTQGGTHAAPVNAQPAGSPTPISEPTVDDLAACLAACKGNPSCIAYTFESGVCKLFGASTSKAKRQQDQASTPKTNDNTNSQSRNTGTTTTTTPTGTHANPINSVPAGAPAPIATPAVNSLAACLAACKGNPACIAYTFESGVCKLFD